MNKKLLKSISLGTITLVIIGVVLLGIHNAEAALARVQVFSGTNTTFASSVTTSSVTVTAGNLIVCGAEADVVAQNGITITDSKSNSWTRVRSDAIAATTDTEIWYSKITTGGSGYTVTATDNGGGVDSIIICEEWSGIATSPLDVHQGATGLSTAMASGNTGSTAQANELVVGVGSAAPQTTLTIGAGYSNLTQVATAFTVLGFQTKTVSSVGTQSAAMTAGDSASWAMQVATFKEAPVVATGESYFIMFE